MNKTKIRIILIILIIAFILSSCLKERKISINDVKQKDIINTAINQLGKKYCYGGKGPLCFDCSGFVYYVYKKNGYNIPATTKGLKNFGEKIKRIKKMKPADIIIFKIKRKHYHTGIYIGDNRFIHSPSKGGKIRIEAMNKYWQKKFKYARRIL